MPNHVTTICTVTGPAAHVAEFAEMHVVLNDRKERFLDFRTIIPKPAILEKTESGSEAELGLWCLTNDAYEPVGHRAQWLRTEAGERPARNGELRAYLEKHKPGVLEKGRLCAQAIAETGYRDWYEWSIANWGTKWGAYDYEDRERGDGRFVFKFETAWSFPEKVFRKLAELHPTLTIAIIAFDEGSNFGCEGEFNGRNDYRCAKELATDDLHERVYGHRPERDEDDESSDCASEGPK